MTKFEETSVPDRGVLLGAAELIETRGLARGTYVRYDEHDVPSSYCLAGALGVAAGVKIFAGDELAVAHKLAEFIVQEVRADASARWVDDEFPALSDHRDPKLTAFYVLPRYSDARLAPEVASMLRKAADAIAPEDAK